MRKLFLVILTGLVAVGVFAWSSGTLSVYGEVDVSITYDSSEQTFNISPGIYNGWNNLVVIFSDSSNYTSFKAKFYLGDSLSLEEAYLCQYLFKSDTASLNFKAGKFDETLYYETYGWNKFKKSYSGAVKFNLEGTVENVTLGIGPVIYPVDEGKSVGFDINPAYVNLSNLGLDAKVIVTDVTGTPSVYFAASLDTSKFSDLKLLGEVGGSLVTKPNPDIEDVYVHIQYTYDPYTLDLLLSNEKADSGFKTDVDAGVSYSTELPVIESVDLGLSMGYSMDEGLKNVTVSAEWSKELISHKFFVEFHPEMGSEKAYAVLGWKGKVSF